MPLGVVYSRWKTSLPLERDVARRFRTDAKCVPSLKRAKREIESSNIRKNWSKPQKRNHMFRSCSLLGQQYGFSICRSRVHLARRTEGATCSNVDERDFGGMLLIVGFATRSLQRASPSI
jgi:hypothetical protein